MKLNILKSNCKRGILGETITWVIATLVIVVILIISVFIVSVARTNKKLEIINHNNLAAAKSLSSYLLTKEDSNINIFEQIRSQEKISSENQNFFIKVFGRLYHDKFAEKILFQVISFSKD